MEILSTQLVQLKSTDLQKVEQEAKQLLEKVSSTDTMELETLMDSIGRMGSQNDGTGWTISSDARTPSE